MSPPYSRLPKKATLRPSEFIVDIPQRDLDEFRTLLKLSKVGPPTYESLQQDRKYGITHQWLKDAKRHWENNFDW
jgi:microsomal epoxide hydrolase